MWYRLAQINSPVLGILSDPTLLYLGNLKKKFFELDYKIQENIKSLSPNQQQKFQNKLNNLRSDLSNLNNNISAQDKVETWNNLLEEVQNQKNNQDRLVIKNLRNLVNNRISLNGLDDADRILKEYLDAQANTNFISDINNKSNLYEIAKFFLDNATDPKYAPVKSILNKFPTKWMQIAEIGDLFLNFYLYTKLTELKSVLERRNPQTDDDKLSIMFIDSKSAIHALKIGTSLFKIVNKNPFGDLLGSISSSAIDALDSFQNMTNVDKEITKRIQ